MVLAEAVRRQGFLLSWTWLHGIVLHLHFLFVSAPFMLPACHHPAGMFAAHIADIPTKNLFFAIDGPLRRGYDGATNRFRPRRWGYRQSRCTTNRPHSPENPARFLDKETLIRARAALHRIPRPLAGVAPLAFGRDPIPNPLRAHPGNDGSFSWLPSANLTAPCIQAVREENAGRSAPRSVNKVSSKLAVHRPSHAKCNARSPARMEAVHPPSVRPRR